MSGAVPLLPLYAFMSTRTGTTLPLFLLMYIRYKNSCQLIFSTQYPRCDDV
jgi:hypothetical protein